mmetsp:Transcript_16658/g.29952  ORF Transcript_16658/g.29952 Transcript_16658/m.29952 type:complete len:96 (-) Transcript_16658:216-503(-)
MIIGKPRKTKEARPRCPQALRETRSSLFGINYVSDQLVVYHIESRLIVRVNGRSAHTRQKCYCIAAISRVYVTTNVGRSLEAIDITRDYSILQKS